MKLLFFKKLLKFASWIKNPFNAILGFTELLQENFKIWNEKQKLEMIREVHNASTKLYQLLENLLHWSRSQRGLIDYKPKPIQLMQVFTNMNELMKNTAKAKNIQLDFSLSNHELTVFADPYMLDTILRNLISNAIKFTNDEDKVHVYVEKIDDHKQYEYKKIVRINVADNGLGISPEVMEKLFRIDKNPSTPGTKKESGTGLGLLLVKEFVSKHGGFIGVDSTVGKGSTFHFTLPMAKE